MNRRSTFALVTVLGLCALPAAGHSQQPADIDAVKAASKAFYSALNTGPEAMLKAYPKSADIVYMSPLMKTALFGWDNVKPQIEAEWVGVPARAVTINGSRIQVRSPLAWEVGNEVGSAKLKDGTEIKIDLFVTNVYEKIGGQWLMVSHHAQPRPQ